MTRLIIVLLDFTLQHPKWFQIYYSDVKLEYCKGVTGCSWLFFFLHGQTWSEISLTAFTNLRALIWTSWVFLLNHDHFYWSNSYCRPQTVLFFLSWWKDQVSIATEVAKEWSMYLKGWIHSKVQDLAHRKLVKSNFSFFLFLCVHGIFMILTTSPKEGVNVICFQYRLSYFQEQNFFVLPVMFLAFSNYCSYSSVYALCMYFILPCLYSYITEVLF